MIRVASKFALLTGQIGFNVPSTYGYIELVRPLSFEEECEIQRFIRDCEEDVVYHHCSRCGMAGHKSPTCSHQVERNAA